MSGQKTLRKSRDRKLFGVAGGLAGYFGIDVVFVRAAFVIAFFTPVPSVLIYLVLALFMPDHDRAQADFIDVTPGRDAERKRFVRVTEEKWIFGVCSGIARYFDLDVVLVRAAFLVAVLGFGTGVLAYLVLALVMPKESVVA